VVSSLAVYYELKRLSKKGFLFVLGLKSPSFFHPAVQPQVINNLARKKSSSIRIEALIVAVE
jgi:hypothetical protein